MPKIKLSWKDPDWYNSNAFRKMTEAEQEAFFEAAHKAGLEEYLDVEFDTDTGIARIVGGNNAQVT